MALGDQLLSSKLKFPSIATRFPNAVKYGMDDNFFTSITEATWSNNC